MKRLIDLFRGGSPAETIEWSRLKPRAIDIVTAAVAPLDLHHQSSLQWVARDSDAQGARRLFRVHDAGAGRPFSVNWGYSFDFVQHLSGKTVHWHRTFKSARRDLWVIPPEELVTRAPQHQGEAVFLEKWHAMIDGGLEQAAKFFDISETAESPVTLLLRASADIAHPAKQPDGSSLMASQFALPFALARDGDLHEAKRLLSSRLEERSVPEDAGKTLLANLDKVAEMP